MQRNQRWARLLTMLMIFGLSSAGHVLFVPSTQAKLFGKKRTPEEQRAYDREQAEKKRRKAEEKRLKAEEKAQAKAVKDRQKAADKKLIDAEKAKQEPLKKQIKEHQNAVKWYAVSLKNLHKKLNLAKQSKSTEKALRKLKTSKVRASGPKIVAYADAAKRKAQAEVSLTTPPALADARDLQRVARNVQNVQVQLLDATQALVETVINAKEFQADADNEQARLLGDIKRKGKKAKRIEKW